ncbi:MULTISPECIES: acyl-CoA thioesterase [unclassified Mycobacterium]|uniref:acyl-CoA thioesterase n=1 Tax=unclassified Mycobacterium TaxID=2642494 RepID=UPI0029C8BB69|nr:MULTISPECIES: thioesterase family protein [unclassified Mycobacterium]
MKVDQYAWRTDVIAPGGGNLGHVDGMQIANILFESWTRYLNDGLDLPHDVVFDDSCRPILRETSTRFDAEVFPGERLTCGVRATQRTAKSFTLSQALWRSDSGVQVAGGTAVLITIDVRSGRAVPIAPRLWFAMRRNGVGSAASSSVSGE